MRQASDYASPIEKIIQQVRFAVAVGLTTPVSPTVDVQFSGFNEALENPLSPATGDASGGLRIKS